MEKFLDNLEKSEKATNKAYIELTKLERQIQREHDKIAAIIANFTDPIIFVNNEGRVSLINPIAREVFKLDNHALNKKIAKKDNYSMENFKKLIKKEYKVPQTTIVKAVATNTS